MKFFTRLRSAQEFRQHLRELRRLSKLTLRQVEEQSGVKFNTIEGWENGAHVPSLPALGKVLAVYGRDLGSMAQGSEVVEVEDERDAAGESEPGD